MRTKLNKGGIEKRFTAQSVWGDKTAVCQDIYTDGVKNMYALCLTYAYITFLEGSIRYYGPLQFCFSIFCLRLRIRNR